MKAFETATKIVSRSVSTTIARPLVTFKDTSFPLLLVCLASILLTYHDLERVFNPSEPQVFQIITDEEGGQQIDVRRRDFLVALLPMASLILAALGTVLLAVLWHRREILRSKTFGGARTVFAYILRALPIGLVVAMALALPSLVVGHVGEFWNIACFAVALYFMFRVSLSLPGTAVGNKVGYTYSWRATRSFALVCLYLAAFQLGLVLLTTALDTVLFQEGIPWAVIICGSMLLSVVQMLISVALITQLYISAIGPGD